MTFLESWAAIDLFRKIKIISALDKAVMEEMTQKNEKINENGDLKEGNSAISAQNEEIKEKQNLLLFSQNEEQNISLSPSEIESSASPSREEKSQKQEGSKEEGSTVLPQTGNAKKENSPILPQGNNFPSSPYNERVNHDGLKNENPFFSTGNEFRYSPSAGTREFYNNQTSGFMFNNFNVVVCES